MILVTSSLLISQNENSSPYSFSSNLDLKIAGLSASLLLGSVLMDYAPMSLDNISNLNSINIIPINIKLSLEEIKWLNLSS